MKKKLALIFSLALTILLASCGGNTSREKEIISNNNIESKMSESLVEKYNLDFAHTSVLSTLAISLGSDQSSSADDYYTVYASKNTEASLIKLSYNADTELSKHIYDGNRNKNVSFIANALYFDVLLQEAKAACYNLVIDENKRTEELPYYKQSLLDIIMNQKVLNILYASDSALTSTTFTNYKFTQDKSASFAKTVASQAAGYALIDNKTNIKFEIVYLPIYVVRRINTNFVAQAVLLPIYATFVVGDKEIQADGNKYKLVDSTIATMPEVSIIFDSETGAILN